MFVDEIRCVLQPSAETIWTWLEKFIPQLVVSVIPVAGGVWIADRSFHKNRQSEQTQWERNQMAAHEQWVRDQKRVEWREVLQSAAEIQHVLPKGSVTTVKRAQEIDKNLKAGIHNLSVTTSRCIFLADFLSLKGKSDRIEGFLREADLYADSISGQIANLRSLQSESTQDERVECPARFVPVELRDLYGRSYGWHEGRSTRRSRS